MILPTQLDAAILQSEISGLNLATTTLKKELGRDPMTLLVFLRHFG